MWTIRRGVVADAAALAAFAERTFRAAFEADNAPEDMTAYVAASFTPARQTTELADPLRVTLLAEIAGGLVAYAQLERGNQPSCVTGPAPVELARFYVDTAWHGRGLAQALWDAALGAAKAAGARTIWLGVWERNARAIAFYRKLGLVAVGEQVFMLGGDPQRDLVMAAPLAATPTR